MNSWTNFNSAFSSIAAREAEFATIVQGKTYEKLEALDYGFLIENVRTGDPIVSILDKPVYDGFPLKAGGDCTIGSCTYEPEYQVGQWILKIAECRYSLCARKSGDKFMALYQKYIRVNPESNVYYFIIERMSDVLSDILANTLVTKLFFALENAGQVNDAAFQNPGIEGFDGWLAQWFAHNSNYVTMSVADIGDGEKWYEAILEGIYKMDEGDYGAFVKDSTIFIDEKGARAIAQWLNGVDNMKGIDCECYDIDGVTSARRFTKDNMRIAGLPVRPVPYTKMAMEVGDDWYGATTAQGSATMTEPIFAVITPQDNNLIGTPGIEDLEMHKVFYDDLSREWKFDIGFQAGAGLGSEAFMLIKAA